MARNRDRMGIGSGAPENIGPPPQAMSQNNDGGFAFVVPTEFVELPSKGRYYSEGHPLCGQESVEIKQMTAKEEDILTSRTLLKKGIALDRVLQSIIIDKKIKSDSILVGDRNAIIIAMRVTGYGREYDTSVECPSCGTNQKYSFDLQEAQVYHGDEASSLGIVDNEDGTFDVELPRTKVSATFRLLTGRDEKLLLRNLEEAKKKRVAERTVTSQLKCMVVAVNGDSSREAIDYFVQNAPSLDSRHLRLAYRLAAPNIDLTQHFACNQCDHEQDMEVPLGADFFWPDR